MSSGNKLWTTPTCLARAATRVLVEMHRPASSYALRVTWTGGVTDVYKCDAGGAVGFQAGKAAGSFFDLHAGVSAHDVGPGEQLEAGQWTVGVDSHPGRACGKSQLGDHSYEFLPSFDDVLHRPQHLAGAGIGDDSNPAVLGVGGEGHHARAPSVSCRDVRAVHLGSSTRRSEVCRSGCCPRRLSLPRSSAGTLEGRSSVPCKGSIPL